MKGKNFLQGFLVTFLVALVVNIVLTLLWDYFVKSRGFYIDWESSIRTALLFGLIIPLSRIWSK